MRNLFHDRTLCIPQSCPLLATSLTPHINKLSAGCLSTHKHAFPSPSLSAPAPRCLASALQASLLCCQDTASAEDEAMSRLRPGQQLSSLWPKPKRVQERFTSWRGIFGSQKVWYTLTALHNWLLLEEPANQSCPIAALGMPMHCAYASLPY